jgi:hypothetical protein
MQDPKSQQEIDEEIKRIDDEWAEHIDNYGRYEGDEDWRIAAHDDVRNSK